MKSFYAEIDVGSSPIPVFTDGDVKKGESCRYRVRAYDTSGNYSDFSEPVIVTTGRASR